MHIRKWGCRVSDSPKVINQNDSVESSFEYEILLEQEQPQFSQPQEQPFPLRFLSIITTTAAAAKAAITDIRMISTVFTESPSHPA